jgi:hypothetical protein
MAGVEINLLGRRDVGWLAGCWSGAWAAGSGEKGGSSGDKGKFHGMMSWFLVGFRNAIHPGWARD